MSQRLKPKIEKYWECWSAIDARDTLRDRTNARVIWETIIIRQGQRKQRKPKELRRLASWYRLDNH